MVEYFTEAIVLDKESIGDYDCSVVLYTRDLGKIRAKAAGARKIISKLNAHLEPLSFSQVRLIYKKQFQVADALMIDKFNKNVNLAEALQLLNFIKEMTVDGENDYDLWSAIKFGFQSGKISYANLLKILGFDPQFAVCHGCRRQPNYFSAKDLSFWCDQCLT